MRVKLCASLAALAMVCAGAASAQTTGSSQLRCTVAGGFGLIVTSGRGITCVYYRGDGAVEFYVGQSSRIGLDVGPTNAVRLAYRVVGADPTRRGQLQGTFGGPDIAATVGAGFGADALVGGATRAIGLLPIANEGLTGLNVNAGVSVLSLRYAGAEPPRRYRR